MRKIVVCLLCIVSLLSFSVVGFAADAPAAEPEYASSGLTIEQSVVAAAAASVSITAKSNSISKYSAGVVNLYSYTATSGVAGEIKVSYTLQRSSNNSSWSTYSTASSSQINRNAHSYSFTKSAPSGYYYRLKTTHKAYVGGVCVSTATATSGSIKM